MRFVSALLLLFAFLLQIINSFESPVTSRMTPSVPTNGTTSSTLPDRYSGSCTDISICRTRYTIIWSSLVTIIACVWTAIHRNIPRPKGRTHWFRHALDRVLEAAKIVVVTLLVPEWVLAWALRQYLSARTFGRELQKACEQTTQEKTSVGENSDTGERERPGSRSSDHGTVGVDQQPDHSPLLPGKYDGHLKDDDLTTRHGFYTIMGGFHLYDKGQPIHPLSQNEVLDLVKTGDIVPPTDEELRGWSQGDTLSKTIAVVQTLWFFVQATARHLEGLPITQLEVMTLAYATMTVAMYFAWWCKPKNVGVPTRVTVKMPHDLPEAIPVKPQKWYWHVVSVISGTQDHKVDLRTQHNVPIFYSGGTGDEIELYADIIALFAATGFGAIHFAAWRYVFPSGVEEIIWRVSSVVIVAVPVLLLAILQPWMSLTGLKGRPTGWKPSEALTYVVIVSGLIYVTARMLLIALAFSTLRSLPNDAYQSVQWTLLIPHFT
ncbi:hypothetical protein BV25DRAFT_1825343 [Artomyces pyxidatus]|uniref:Uncharacterized protein n=1 Tax=Artomyces pyxidatus TaxID=48021 RepID=A0ACB8T1T6_9AGAM|nr:hypothetical protein BV25DRAFT_1825343 [Artomyces pyxidatus]